jgi:hypothetical protein
MLANLEKIELTKGKPVKMIFTSSDEEVRRMSFEEAEMLQAKPCDLYFELRLPEKNLQPDLPLTGEDRPAAPPQDRALYHALHDFEGAEEFWASAFKDGITDDQLTVALVNAWSDDESVHELETVEYRYYRSEGNPNFDWRDRGTEPWNYLSLAALLAMARNLLALPGPGAEGEPYASLDHSCEDCLAVRPCQRLETFLGANTENAPKHYFCSEWTGDGTVATPPTEGPAAAPRPWLDDVGPGHILIRTDGTRHRIAAIEDDAEKPFVLVPVDEDGRVLGESVRLDDGEVDAEFMPLESAPRPSAVPSDFEQQPDPSAISAQADPAPSAPLDPGPVTQAAAETPGGDPFEAVPEHPRSQANGKTLEYTDDQGAVCYVGQESATGAWVTLRRAPGRAAVRIRSPKLPETGDRGQAEGLLKSYADSKGWQLAAGLDTEPLPKLAQPIEVGKRIIHLHARQTVYEITERRAPNVVIMVNVADGRVVETTLGMVEKYYVDAPAELVPV